MQIWLGLVIEIEERECGGMERWRQDRGGQTLGHCSILFLYYEAAYTVGHMDGISSKNEVELALHFLFCHVR